jgi:ABC-2 type transport system permease protein
MKSLLQFESMKLRTLRSTWVLAGVALVLAGVIGTAQVLAREPGVALPSLARTALSPAQPVWFVVIVLAVLATAGEFQHRTIRTTLLAAPHRVPVGLAKAVVAGALGAALVALAGLVATGTALGTALATGAHLPIGSVPAWGHVAGAVALGALWGVFAAGLGVLTRSTAVALTAVLLWRFVGEGLLPVLLRRPELSRWTPTGAGAALVGMGGSTVLPLAAAVLVLLGWTALVGGLAGWLFVRSDPA